MTNQRSRHRRPRASRSAFTLVEIMIALTVGGIALSSIYAVGAASTRHFREQQRISAAQTSLRSAMDRLKRDFQRAGFLSTPNVQAGGEGCSLPGPVLDNTTASAGTGRLAAISMYTDNQSPRPPSLDPDDLNKWATVDQVLLIGNYTTAGEYPGVSVNAGGTTITFPATTQSFQRDFADWSGPNAGQCNQTVFANAFAVGRMVRIHTQIDRVFFSTIQQATCAGTQATVVINDPVPPQCNPNLGWIAPVNVINVAAADAAGDQTSRTDTVNRVTILRRTEMSPIRKDTALTPPASPLAIDDRSILDYLVSFNVQFMITNPAVPSTINWAPATEAAVRQNPERIRGVIIDLVARTAEHEPEFDASRFQQGLAFKVLPTVGGARVRSLHAEILLTNIAYKGY